MYGFTRSYRPPISVLTAPSTTTKQKEPAQSDLYLVDFNMSLNDDLKSMTLLQLLQSFPDPPTSITIDPSLLSPTTSKPRASIMFPPISAPSLVTNDGYTSISPVISSTFSSSPQASPPRSSSQSTPPAPTFQNQPQPLSLSASSPTLPPMPAQALLSPQLAHMTSSPSSSHLSQSTSSIPKVNGSSPPLANVTSSGNNLRSSAPIFKSAPSTPVDTVDLVTRGCKGELVGQDWQKMNELLVELTPESLSTTLEKCYDNHRSTLASKSKLKNVMKKSDEPTYLKVSKHLLDFKYNDGRLCPLDTDLEDDVVITNIGPGKAKFKVSPIPPATTHILSVTPKDGILKKKQSLTLQFKLRLRTTTKLRKVVTIELEGGCKYFMVVSVDSEKSVFGVNVDELDCVDDNGLRVPQVLVTLRKYLYAHNGLRQEGVFRVQGDEKELQRIKNQLNKGTFTECIDVNCIASLIKLWYRELPSPILNIPIESLRAIESEEECVSIYNALPEPNRSLMTWLMDVMADASRETSNKMTPRNFAICVAPNLFTSTGTNPADSLFISGKVVHFVSQILNHRLKIKYG